MTLPNERFLGTLHSLGSPELIVFAPVPDSIDRITDSIY